MPRRGVDHFAPVEKGGLARDTNRIFSHLMPGAADISLLQDTAKLELRVKQDGAVVRVNATVTNEKAGHHIPTDHPARNMLLLVNAKDATGRLLSFLRGPLVPEWGGQGEDATDYAGRPGKGFAKILEELWTEVSPTAAYWNPTIVREDTRIPALGSDESQYEFRAPAEGGTVNVEARLIFRRAFRSLAKQKTWEAPDIVMEQVNRTIETSASQLSALAVVPAATFASGASVAPDSLATGFGEGLAASPRTASSATPPTTLEETSVMVEDSLGIERPAHLLFVSYGQINFVVPPGTAVGPATNKVLHMGRPVAEGKMSVEPVAPTLFSADGSGHGVAAAVAVRVADDGSQERQLVYRCSAGLGCVAVPIEFCPESEHVVLQLLGSGIRGFSSLLAIKVRIGGSESLVLSAGPQGQTAGLDHVDVVVPSNLVGRGGVTVALTVDGRDTNPVTVSIQ